MKWDFWKRPFNSYVFLWMALGLLILTILLIAGALASRERNRWVSHTLEILEQLERYESNILAAQVGIRGGTVWTDHHLNQEAAETGIGNAQQAVEHLLELTIDNPRQAVRVRVLKSLSEQLISRIRARMQAPPLIAIEEDVSDLPLTDTVNEIRKEERALLEQRQGARLAADNTFWVLTAIALGGNLLIVWRAFTASRRYLMERNHMDTEIRALNTRLADQVAAVSGLNASLEDRVAEKTIQLEATVAKLQDSNQELERFAYVASHDMQEPLRQVASFNNLLSLKYGDQLDATAKRYLEYSVAGAKRLQLMLRGLLQYTIITPAAVYRCEIPVESMMQATLQELHLEIEETGSTVLVDAPAGLSIVGDLDMLRVLTMALVSNAIKFRQKDVPAIVSVAFERLPHQWSMTVSDNGIGIDERFIPRMFEMFARFHPVGEHTGAGVGLALSKRIVDCHGGKLTVEPGAAGRGTIFTVQVPVLSKDQQNALETGRFPY